MYVCVALVSDGVDDDLVSDGVDDDLVRSPAQSKSRCPNIDATGMLSLAVAVFLEVS